MGKTTVLPGTPFTVMSMALWLQQKADEIESLVVVITPKDDELETVAYCAPERNNGELAFAGAYLLKAALEPPEDSEE